MVGSGTKHRVVQPSLVSWCKCSKRLQNVSLEENIHTRRDKRSGWGPCGTRVHTTLGISTGTNTVYYPHTVMLKCLLQCCLFHSFTFEPFTITLSLIFFVLPSLISHSSITHLSLCPSFPQADSVQPTGVRFSPGFLLPPLFSFLNSIVVPSMVLVNELLGGHSPRVNLLLFSFGLFPISFCCFLFPSPSLFFLFVPFSARLWPTQCL